VLVPLFRKPAGKANLRDILEALISCTLKHQHSRTHFEKWETKVRKGRKGLKAANDEIRAEIVSGRYGQPERDDMRMLGQWFSHVYWARCLLEKSSTPALTQHSSGDEGHGGSCSDGSETLHNLRNSILTSWRTRHPLWANPALAGTLWPLFFKYVTSPPGDCDHNSV
jgi:hypothetical protein